jgi:LysM repeat protein
MLMTKKLISILAVGVALAILLSACQRSASTVPMPTPTATGNPLVTDPMLMLQSLATQTALAGTGLPISGTPPEDLTGTPIAVGTIVSPTPTSLIPPTGEPGITTTPATPLAITVTPPARPATYTLHEGEFPYCIARRFNIDPEALLSLNDLSGGEMFSPGLVLTIPQTAAAFPSPRALIQHPATYTIQANDTIYSIGCKYGDVDPLAIAAVNGLTAPYTLTVGQSLSIP